MLKTLVRLTAVAEWKGVQFASPAAQRDEKGRHQAKMVTSEAM